MYSTVRAQSCSQREWREFRGRNTTTRELRALLGSWGAVCSHFPRRLRSTELGLGGALGWDRDRSARREFSRLDAATIRAAVTRARRCRGWRRDSRASRPRARHGGARRWCVRLLVSGALCPAVQHARVLRLQILLKRKSCTARAAEHNHVYWPRRVGHAYHAVLGHVLVRHAQAALQPLLVHGMCLLRRLISAHGPTAICQATPTTRSSLAAAAARDPRPAQPAAQPAAEEAATAAAAASRAAAATLAAALAATADARAAASSDGQYPGRGVPAGRPGRHGPPGCDWRRRRGGVRIVLL